MLNEFGQTTIGGCVSETTTVIEHVAKFPAASDAKYWTRVVPNGYADPSAYPGGDEIYSCDTTPTLSVAVIAGQVTMAVGRFKSVE